MNENLINALLRSLDEWEEDLIRRYPDPETIIKDKAVEEYRNYETPVRDTVKEFYRLNHTYQTYDLYRRKERNSCLLIKKK